MFLAGGLIAAIVVVLLAGPAAWSQPGRPERAEPSAEVRAALSDGRLTTAEYREAYERFEACAGQAGLRVGPPRVSDEGFLEHGDVYLGATPEEAEQNAAAFDACWEADMLPASAAFGHQAVADG